MLDLYEKETKNMYDDPDAIKQMSEFIETEEQKEGMRKYNQLVKLIDAEDELLEYPPYNENQELREFLNRLKCII